MQFCNHTWTELNGNILPARDAFLIELGLATGLRVEEMADLQCQDLQAENGMCSVVVRKGKGDKRRVIKISNQFKQRCIRFAKLKESLGEPTYSGAPIFYSWKTSRALTKRTLQRSFKRVMKQMNFPDYYSIHALRHTYGTQLCRASGQNLKLVQQQMGHTSIKSTEVYLHVEDTTLNEAVENHSRLLNSKD